MTCWGSNMGLGGYHTVGQSTPPSGEFVSVSAGGYHTCGLRPDGTIACWGWDVAGQSTPPSGEFVSVSAGLFHTCGLRPDGTVACWGDDEESQSTPPSSLGAPIPVPTPTPTGTPAVTQTPAPASMPTAPNPTETPASTQTPTPNGTLTSMALPDLIVGIEARLKSNPAIVWGDGCIVSSGGAVTFHVVEATVHVRNVGSGDAGSFTVRLNNDATEIVDVLKAGAHTTLLFSTWASSEHIAMVDADFSIEESDESNNTVETFLLVPTLVPPAPTCKPSG